MTEAEKIRFNDLRRRVMNGIKKELAIDDCCKSYDGCFEILQEYPTYFDDPEAEMGPSFYCITLHCYVLGPCRHYDWTGATFSEALDNAEKDIDDWLLRDDAE